MGLQLAHFPKAIAMDQMLHSGPVCTVLFSLSSISTEPLSGKCMWTERIGYLVFSCNAANDITVLLHFICNRPPREHAAKSTSLPFPLAIKTELASLIRPSIPRYTGVLKCNDGSKVACIELALF